MSQHAFIHSLPLPLSLSPEAKDLLNCKAKQFLYPKSHMVKLHKTPPPYTLHTNTKTNTVSNPLSSLPDNGKLSTNTERGFVWSIQW